MEMNGTTARNGRMKIIRFPDEESLFFNPKRGLMVVADGVTRDLQNGRAATADPLGALGIFFNYPRPSPAKNAADIVTYSVHEAFKENNGSRGLWEAMRYANRELARTHEISSRNGRVMIGYTPTNYLERDLPGCVAAVAHVDEGVVHWAYITDAGIARINANGDLVDKVQGDPPKSLAEFAGHNAELASMEREGTLSWKHNRARQIVRGEFRNRPGNQHSYGVLTGEPTADHYIEAGSWKRDEDDTILVFTDGAGDVLFGRDGDVTSATAEYIRSGNMQKVFDELRKKVRSEGSLIYATDRQ